MCVTCVRKTDLCVTCAGKTDLCFSSHTYKIKKMKQSEKIKTKGAFLNYFIQLPIILVNKTQKGKKKKKRKRKRNSFTFFYVYKKKSIGFVKIFDRRFSMNLLVLRCPERV